MTKDPHDVVRVAAGELLTIELYQARLSEAGITSRVVGESLDTGFAGMLPNSIELWIHRSDVERATQLIKEFDGERAQS